jgi:arylsulfatase A
MKARFCLLTTVMMCSVTIGRPAFAQQPAGAANSARSAFPVPASVRVVRDIVYAQYDARQLKLDLYFPPESGQRQRTPAILVVRGGAWLSGDKDAFSFIAGQLAKAGFVAASIEYRTATEAKFPAAVHDVKAAVRWIRAHAATYDIDQNAIGAIGGSAGGHLVALLATSSGVRELEGQGGNAETSSQVQAVVAMACVCHLEVTDATVKAFIGEPLEEHADAIKAASPVTYVSSRSAPLLLLHSRTDPVVPFAQSVEIEELYRRAGASAALRPIDAPQTHAFWNDARYFPENIKEAIQFFQEHLK